MHSSLFQFSKTIFICTYIIRTVVIQNDGKNRDLVSLRDPVNTPWNREQKCSITHDLYDEFAFSGTIFELGCEFDTKTSTTGPSKSTTSTIYPRARERGLDVVCNEPCVGHGFDGKDRIFRYQFAESRAEMTGPK